MQHDDDRDDRSRGTAASSTDSPASDEQQREERAAATADEHVDQRAGGPEEEADRLHVEGDRLAGDEHLVVESVRPGCGRTVAEAMGSSKADGPRRPRRRPARRVGAPRRALEAHAPARRRGGRRAHRRATRPRHPTSRRCKTSAGSTAQGDHLSIEPRARAAAVHRERPRTRCARFRGSSRCSCPRRCTGCGGRRSRSPSSRSSSPRSYAWWIARRSRGARDARHRGRAASSTPRRSFTDYYTENPAASFAGTVWTNNAWIAAQCVPSASLGVWVPWCSCRTRRASASRRRSCSRSTRPTSSSSTSLRTGCSSSRASSSPPRPACGSSGPGSRPGARSRGEALAEDARSLVHASRSGWSSPCFVSGIIEGFVTAGSRGRGRSRSASARSRWRRFLVYMLVLGGRACARGRDRRPRRVRGRREPHRRAADDRRMPRRGHPPSSPRARDYAVSFAGRSNSARKIEAGDERADDRERR